MVSETQSLICAKGLCNAKALQMDAEKLDFPDSSFDYVLCGLAIPFFSDSLESINEMYRVLKNGGRIGLSTWKKRGGKGAIDKAYDTVFPKKQNMNSNNITSRPDFGSMNGIKNI